MKTLFIVFFFNVWAVAHTAWSQAKRYTLANAHSHNDYEQQNPFRAAFELGFGSIEVDIFLKDNELYVAHEPKNIHRERTFRKLYLEPLIKSLSDKKKQKWVRKNHFQLLIDLKTGGETLKVLTEQLLPYRKFFDQNQNKNFVQIVISGNMPLPGQFENYDSIFSFDGRKNISYDPPQQQRVKLISENFYLVGRFNADGTLPEQSRLNARQFVEECHAKGAKVRFWNTPNKIKSFEALSTIGVDYIGTDSLQLLADYLTKTTAKPHKQ